MARNISKSSEVVENTVETVETAALMQPETPKATQEPAYSVNELAANAKRIFGTRQECVDAALKASGKTESTVSEAKKIVGNFLKKEVK